MMPQDCSVVAETRSLASSPSELPQASPCVAATEPPKRFYCPELDGLRFLAFFLVFLHHAPTYGEGSPALLATYGPYGWMGVDLFLCLSSFLISKLLLLEWQSTGKVSLFQFYVRRSLRIWPLYFFMCFLGFAVVPWVEFFGPAFGSDAYSRMVENFLLPYLTFLGNWATANHGYPNSRALFLLWTISLEEQFYILWPLVLLALNFRRRSLLKLSAVLLAGTILFRACAIWWGWRHPAIYVSLWTRLDPFVLGALLAFYQEEVCQWTKRIRPGWLALAGLTSMWVVTRFPNLYANSPHLIWQFFLCAAGPCLLIAAAIQMGRLNDFLSSYPLVQLGRISYGLYVYHSIALGVIAVFWWKVLKVADVTHSGFGLWVLHVGLALGLTIVIAWLSYHLYEKQFLKLKERFTAVKSRPI